MQQVLKDIKFSKPNIGYIPILDKLVTHGFSWGKDSGNMSFTYGEKTDVIKRINLFLEKLDMSTIENTVDVAVEHDNKIIDITQKLLLKTPPTDTGRSYKCDAVFTKIKGLALTMKPADCTISIIYAITESGEEVVGLVHAGRKGLDLQIPAKAIKHLIDNYKCDIKNIKIGVAPAITVENYFIKDISELTNPQYWEGFTQKRDGLVYLDLIGLMLKQYSSVGILSDQIQLYDVDTFQAAKNGETHSHRFSQMNPDTVNGRMIVAAQLAV